MDSSEFSASGSEDDVLVGESSSTGLDLARVVRQIEPPVTPRTRARGESHGVVTEMITCYSVCVDDLCNETMPLHKYHLKLLTPVDVAHIFRGTSDMRGVLEVELGRGAYLILLADDAQRDPKTRQVAKVQVAPCATQAMARLRIGFALNIRFPNGTSRIAALHWLMAEDHSSLMLQLAETDHDKNEVLVACTTEDDLLFFDVHFTRDGVVLPDFVVMRASMTVGVYARAVVIDRELINKRHDRLYTPATRFVNDSVALESFSRTSDDRAFHTIHSMAPHQHWQHVTKTYKTTDGWYHLIPSGKLNRHASSSAAELSASVHVNVDDAIHQATQELFDEVLAELAFRSQTQCATAVRNLVQTSAPTPSELSDTEDAYLTTDEGHKSAVRAMRGKGKRPADAHAEDPEACELMYFYVLHRHRMMYRPDAFASITIPPHINAALHGEVFAARLAKDRSDTTSYTSQYIMNGLLAREAAGQLPRTVHLRDWRLQCPLSFVGETLTRMIDCDVYRSILAQNQPQHMEMQRAMAMTRAHGDRSWGVWSMLCGAAAAFGSCSSSASRHDK